MNNLSIQNIIYNGQFFVFLSRNQMSISHCHCNSFMPHQFLKLHNAHFSRLCQPRSKSVPHCMKSYNIQAVFFISFKPEFSYSCLETMRCVLKRLLCSWSLKNIFRRSSSIGKKHGQNVSWNSNRNTLSTLGQNMQNAGIGIDVPSLETEHFCRPEASFQG